MIFGGQQSAVRPSGFGVRKKPRHLEMLEAQRGMATSSVVAQKQRQQQEEETAFNRAQSEKSLAMQQQQVKQAEESAETQKKIGYASTGVSLLNTIMSFFG